MKVLLPVLFALVAAVGNAMFALGQKRSMGVENGVLFVGLSALVAFVLALLVSPLLGKFEVAAVFKWHSKALLLSGVGLFFTYLGFNLLYTKFGVSQYALYAVISIITTTIVVGVWWLKEPVNVFHKLAVVLAIIAVVLFSIGQSKT